MAANNNNNNNINLHHHMEHLMALRSDVELIIVKLLGIDTIDYAHVGLLFDDVQCKYWPSSSSSSSSIWMCSFPISINISRSSIDDYLRFQIRRLSFFSFIYNGPNTLTGKYIQDLFFLLSLSQQHTFLLWKHFDLFSHCYPHFNLIYLLSPYCFVSTKLFVPTK